MTQPQKISVVGVHLSDKHRFSKQAQLSIRLIAGMGVDGDVHSGEHDQHRYHIRKFGLHPNLRQVHLIQSELLDALGAAGHPVKPGELGENVCTRGLDLERLPVGARLHIGTRAVIELTGLRNPCVQIEKLQAGLFSLFARKGSSGVIRRAGVMSTVLTTGNIRVGDTIEIELPAPPLAPLIYRKPNRSL